MKDSIVLVTGFVERSLPAPRSAEDYVEKGRTLLALPGPKVLFMDRKWMHLVEKDAAATDTLVVPTSLSDLKYHAQLPALANKAQSGNALKDTLEYYAMILQKTEWMRQALVLRPGGQKYVWLDFGLAHVTGGHLSPPRFDRIPDDRVRIAGIDPATQGCDCGPSHPLWVFAGGVFGGSPEPLRIFADEVDEECRRLIDNEQTLMWEVNVWYRVFDKRPQLFDWYAANHDASILQNL